MLLEDILLGENNHSLGTFKKVETWNSKKERGVCWGGGLSGVGSANCYCKCSTPTEANNNRQVSYFIS
jgi:hypothetical protein